MLPDTQRKSFQTLQEQKCVEWRQRRTGIAQKRDSGAGDVCRSADVLGKVMP
jgi:hypothetical protein